MRPIGLIIAAQELAVGEKRGQQLVNEIAGIAATHRADVFFLSFRDVRVATLSYLSPVLRALLLGELAVVPVLCGLNAEVGHEVRCLLDAMRRPCLLSSVAMRKSEVDFESARVEVAGPLDLALRETIEQLYVHGEATGAWLGRVSPEVKITRTAWNNRLRDLWSLRLITREATGREAIYRPIGAELEPELP